MFTPAKPEKNRDGKPSTGFTCFFVLLAHSTKRTQPRATALAWGLWFFRLRRKNHKPHQNGVCEGTRFPHTPASDTHWGWKTPQQVSPALSVACASEETHAPACQLHRSGYRYQASSSRSAQRPPRLTPTPITPNPSRSMPARC